jgi:hypothetical protein
MLLTWARAANSGGGGKVRLSLRTLVMCWPAAEDMATVPVGWGERSAATLAWINADRKGVKE